MNPELEKRIKSAIVDPNSIAEEIGEAHSGLEHLQYVEVSFVESLAGELSKELQLAQEAAAEADRIASQQISSIAAERDELRSWKASASVLLEKLDLQKLGELLEVPAGQSVSENLLPAVSELLSKLRSWQATFGTSDLQAAAAKRERAAELTATMTSDLKSALEECSQLKAQVAVMRKALLPFAKMHREESDLPDDHFVVSRGVASGLTMLVERDFRNAAAALRSDAGAALLERLQKAEHDLTYELKAKVEALEALGARLKSARLIADVHLQMSQLGKTIADWEAGVKAIVDAKNLEAESALRDICMVTGHSDPSDSEGISEKEIVEMVREVVAERDELRSRLEQIVVSQRRQDKSLPTAAEVCDRISELHAQAAAWQYAARQTGMYIGDTDVSTPEKWLSAQVAALTTLVSELEEAKLRIKKLEEV